MNTYFEAVKDSIEEYFGNNGYDAVDLEGCKDLTDIEVTLYDFCWNVDDITGNMSGSWFFDSNKAREMVLENMDTVREALEGFGVSANEIGNRFLCGDWEWLDVTARCFVLGEAVAAYVRENPDELEDQIL